jgi:hypothetical protein
LQARGNADGFKRLKRRLGGVHAATLRARIGTPANRPPHQLYFTPARAVHAL